MILFLIMMERAGLIILLAYAFVHVPVIRETLSQPKSKRHQIILLILFSCFALISNVTGVEIQSDFNIANQTLGHIAEQSSVANTRVLTIGVAGLIAGPLTGIVVGAISMLLRYWQGGLNPHIYMVSSLLIGLCSGVIGNLLRKREQWITVPQAMLVGMSMEILQMLCILILGTSIQDSFGLVRFIALPMIVANTLGIGIFTSIITATRRLEEQTRALQTHDVLKLANKTLPYLRQGLSVSSCQPVADIIYQYMRVAAVSLTNRDTILAYVGASADHHTPNNRILTKLAKRVIETGELIIAKTREDIECDHEDCALSSAIVIPLKVEDDIIGTLKLYFSARQKMTYVDQELAEGLGNIFSTQLALGQAETEARLLQDAEMKSLQAQINPHFLFNSLNTILALIRMDGEKARQLLQEFSRFLRANLQGTRQNVIPLRQEMSQVNAYLALEEARFPNKVNHILHYDEKCDGDILVPPFILQVLIENAYKHAFKNSQKGNQLEVMIERDAAKLTIIVKDNGQGIPTDRLATLGKAQQVSNGGTGTALDNLARRLAILYGKDSQISFVSSEEGTTVRICLPIIGEKGEEK